MSRKPISQHPGSGKGLLQATLNQTLQITSRNGGDSSELALLIEACLYWAAVPQDHGRKNLPSLMEMILEEDPKHVFQLDTNLSLSLSLCLSPSLRLSLSLVLDLASFLVSA